MLLEDIPGGGLVAVTSADRLHAGWLEGLRGGEESDVARLLAPLGQDAALVTLIDGHPATLSWLGAVARHRVYPLGVEHFGQSGDLPDLYRVYRLDADPVLDAAAPACLEPYHPPERPGLPLFPPPPPHTIHPPSSPQPPP